MTNKTIDNEQGHWILAKMGKRVLRPGGKDLTQRLIRNLGINNNDDVVEFAPGLGFTAAMTLKANPKSYTGIELNDEVSGRLRKFIKGPGRRIVNANAANSTLMANSRSKVYGEAMLTMQADHRKAEIINEAHRILKPGGLYGIHELGLHPDTISEQEKAEIQRELALVIRVNARPLTVQEWIALLEGENFRVIKVETSEMSLLEYGRIFSDEGFFRTIRIGYNILTNKAARKRILAMRSVFRKYQKQLNAVSIVAEKL